MIKNNVVSLFGFADIDVPTPQDTQFSEIEEPDTILVNPCTGLVVMNVRTGNLVDVGGNVYGTGCEDLAPHISPENLLGDASSAPLFEDVSNAFDSFGSCFAENDSDAYSLGCGFDDFC